MPERDIAARAGSRLSDTMHHRGTRHWLIAYALAVLAHLGLLGLPAPSIPQAAVSTDTPALQLLHLDIAAPDQPPATAPAKPDLPQPEPDADQQPETEPLEPEVPAPALPPEPPAPPRARPAPSAARAAHAPAPSRQQNTDQAQEPPRTPKPSNTTRAHAAPARGSHAGVSESASPAPAAHLALARYQTQLAAHLARHKHYPRLARRLRQHGQVMLALTLDGRGRVLERRISSSSGYPLLDREAEDLLHRAAPLPKPPPTLSTPLALRLPITFNLD